MAVDWLRQPHWRGEGVASYKYQSRVDAHKGCRRGQASIPWSGPCHESGPRPPGYVGSPRSPTQVAHQQRTPSLAIPGVRDSVIWLVTATAPERPGLKSRRHVACPTVSVKPWRSPAVCDVGVASRFTGSCDGIGIGPCTARLWLAVMWGSDEVPFPVCRPSEANQADRVSHQRHTTPSR